MLYENKGLPMVFALVSFHVMDKVFLWEHKKNAPSATNNNVIPSATLVKVVKYRTAPATMWAAATCFMRFNPQVKF